MSRLGLTVLHPLKVFTFYFIEYNPKDVIKVGSNLSVECTRRNLLHGTNHNLKWKLY